MRPALDEGDQDFLQLLHGRGDSTIQELCEAAGVTATAIRQRLARLLDLNLVERVAIRTGRGRPHHNYRLTDVGRQSLGDNYGELARLLWDQIQAIPTGPVRDRLLDGLKDEFAKRLGAAVNGGTVDQRLIQLKVALEARGFDVQVDHDSEGPAILRERYCPYHELAVADRRICDLEQQVFEQILGAPLELVQSCRDGGSCCEFRVAEPTADLRVGPSVG
jgi:predicted ArsR family transcriptional regulator